MKEPMYILTYDHGGYVLWEKEVKPRLKKIAVWLEKYPKLKIGLDYESFTFDEFSRCDPEVVELIADLLKKYPNRFGLGATTYGQPLSLTISEESNARQLIYAVRTNLHYFGQTPDVYSISEFALNNQTPQLASLCGYKAAILRSHVMGYGYPKTFGSAWGRWIGKDLTEMPSVPTYHGQGRGYNCTTLDNWILSRWSRDSRIYSLEDFEKIFSDYSPLLASRYDDLTQPIEELTEYIETKDNYQYLLLEEIPEVYGEAKDELKTTDNDFHVQMPWGYCGNEIFNGCRESEVGAVQAEKLNALSVMLGGASLQKKSEEAWKYALAAQHHDVTICGLLDLSRRFIPASLAASEQVKEQSLKALSTAFADRNEEGILAVNLHSFDVDEWVNDIHVELKPFCAKRLADKAETVEGYAWNDEDCELVTPLYRLKLTDSGVAYIDDAVSNRRIVDNGEGELFSAWVEDRECVSCGKWEVTVSENGAVAVQNGEIGGITYRFEMSFNGNNPRINCKSRFEMHGEHVGRTDVTQGRPVPLTVNGHHHEDKLCFTMNACLKNDRRIVRDLPYSVSDWNGALRKTEEYWYPDDEILIDVEVPPEESFASTTYTHGIYWFSLRDDKNGVAVLNRGCMGAAIHGNHVSVPLLYSNLYMCGTRILDGVFEDEFALLPFDSSLSDADIHRNAMSFAYPPTVEKLPKGEGNLTELTAAEFNSNGGEVVLTALYPEDGAILARFCNYSDESAAAEFKSAFGAVNAETDLLGNVISAIKDGKLNFRPWEIKTVRIEIK